LRLFILKMDSLRKLVKQTLSDIYPMAEAHYTTWKKIQEAPIDKFEGEQTSIVDKLAKHFKINKLMPLGSGTSGFAYYIPNNRVLKITKDKSEAAEAYKIQNKKLKHLANIYGTYSLKGKYEGTYVIISELLTKSEEIDNADQLLADFLDSEFGYSISFFFEDYSNGSMSKEEIQDYTKRLKEFYEPGEAQQTIWYMTGKFGIIDEIRKYRIHSTDWGLTNIGLKKDGNLAMYDLGYGDPDVPKGVHDIHLNEKQLEEFWSADEYPQFDDGQFNPTFHNRPSLSVMNMNTAPMREAEMSQEEVNVQLLPLEYHYMFDDFVTNTTEAELREIAPTLDLNRNTKDIVLDIKKNYPSLYDNFAEFIDDRLNKV